MPVTVPLELVEVTFAAVFGWSSRRSALHGLTSCDLHCYAWLVQVA